VNPFQLLEQAGRLTRSRTTDTQPADFRRAVSAAYYALFHLVTQDAAGRLTASAALRPLVARKFEHGQLKQVSIQFSGEKLQPKSPLAVLVPSIPADLRSVAAALHDLQGQRHQADYDSRPEADFTRTDAISSVARARVAFEAWARVREQPEAEVFLFAILFRDLGSR